MHTVFTHDPSTLRLASKSPAMQNLPRTGAARQMFVAPPGHTFWAVDFAGIENILVGWLAKSERYVRLSKLDMHSFYTAYSLYELSKTITYADLPQESWPDDQLRAALKALKARFPRERQINKSQIHGGNYMEGPGMIQEQLLKETHRVVPLRAIKRLQSFYFELFPEIRAWHRRATGLEWAEVCPDISLLPVHEGAYQRGYLRTPFGNIHRYYDVLAHVKGPKGWELRYSTDAKRAVAFVPQSSARMVLTRAAQRLAPDVQATLRLFIHDEMLGMCQNDYVACCLVHASDAMQQPVPELSGLTLPTESKQGPVWGEMQ